MQDITESEIMKAADLDVDYDSQKIQMLEKLKGADLTKPCIFSGAQPDPDGLASMYTLSAILEMWGHAPVCFYRGSFTQDWKAIRHISNSLNQLGLQYVFNPLLNTFSKLTYIGSSDVRVVDHSTQILRFPKDYYTNRCCTNTKGFIIFIGMIEISYRS